MAEADYNTGDHRILEHLTRNNIEHLTGNMTAVSNMDQKDIYFKSYHNFA